MKAIPTGSSLGALPQRDVKREMKLREQIKDRFEASNVWSHFKGENPMAELFGLHSIQDYIRAFELHLPEVYEETFRIEQTASLFITDPNRAVLTVLMVALRHAGQNHINFVQPALDWASDEDFWN